MKAGSSGSERSGSTINFLRTRRSSSLILLYSRSEPRPSTANLEAGHPILRITKRGEWNWYLLPRATNRRPARQRTGSSSQSWRDLIPNVSLLRGFILMRAIRLRHSCGTRGAGNPAVTCLNLSMPHSFQMKRKSRSLVESRPLQ